MYTVILLSAGRGNRMHESIPKQYLLLAGKPMIMHSLERLDRLTDVGEIIIVCETAYIDSIRKMLHEYNITKEVVFVNGGQTRQESVYNGLTAAKFPQVVIHEAARPFVKYDEFQKLLDCDAPNVIYGYDIPFTVLRGKENVDGVLNRSELINVQLPQKFDTRLLLDAHKKAISMNASYTEDASLLFDIEGSQIKVLRGTSYNVKITDQIDMLLGEMIYKNYIINRE